MASMSHCSQTLPQCNSVGSWPSPNTSYSEKFLHDPNFRDFHNPWPKHENKNFHGPSPNTSYSEKFLHDPNFRDFHNPWPKHENKNFHGSLFPDHTPMQLSWVVAIPKYNFLWRRNEIYGIVSAKIFHYKVLFVLWKCAKMLLYFVKMAIQFTEVEWLWCITS